MQIPLINEHLFCKYFARLSVGNATKGFATCGCFHPCFLLNQVYQHADTLENIDLLNPKLNMLTVKLIKDTIRNVLENYKKLKVN